MKTFKLNFVLVILSCFFAGIILQGFQQIEGQTGTCLKNIGDEEGDHWPVFQGYCYWNDFYEGNVIYCIYIPNASCQQTECDLDADPGCHIVYE